MRNKNFMLAEVDFDVVENAYSDFFSSLNKETFKAINEKYKKLYTNIYNLIKEGYKFYGYAGRGRTPMQYWRNMLYGWYFERLLEDFLKLNPKIKKVEL